MPMLKKDQLEEMLLDLQMDYLHMNRRQYNLMEVFITGGDPREWHLACERALMRYLSIYQPYFQLLWQGRKLLDAPQLKARLETARQMKDTIATTSRILEHLEAQRQMETPVPVELEHLVQLGSHVEDYLQQSVPFPDEKHKWEWLASLGDTPQAKELAHQPLSELFLYESFLFWYLPRHVGTLNQYLLQQYLGGYPSAL
jgi:L-lysine 2,3-aminomutase